MPSIIEISDLTDPRLDLFARLTLPHKTRAEKKFIAELEAEDDAFKHRNAKKLDRREQ